MIDLFVIGQAAKQLPPVNVSFNFPVTAVSTIAIESAKMAVEAQANNLEWHFRFLEIAGSVLAVVMTFAIGAIGFFLPWSINRDQKQFLKEQLERERKEIKEASDGQINTVTDSLQTAKSVLEAITKNVADLSKAAIEDGTKRERDSIRIENAEKRLSEIEGQTQRHKKAISEIEIKSLRELARRALAEKQTLQALDHSLLAMEMALDNDHTRLAFVTSFTLYSALEQLTEVDPFVAATFYQGTSNNPFAIVQKMRALSQRKGTKALDDRAEQIEKIALQKVNALGIDITVDPFAD